MSKKKEIVKFDDKLKEFIGQNVKVECNQKPDIEGVLMSWDFKHQSILIEDDEYDNLTFVRGSDICRISLNDKE